MPIPISHMKLLSLMMYAESLHTGDDDDDDTARSHTLNCLLGQSSQKGFVV